MDLLEEYGVSATFNVVDLSLYYAESEELPSLRANPSQEGDPDGAQGFKDTNEEEESS